MLDALAEECGTFGLNAKLCQLQRRNSIDQQFYHAGKEIEAAVDKLVYIGSEMEAEGKSDSEIIRNCLGRIRL